MSIYRGSGGAGTASDTAALNQIADYTAEAEDHKDAAASSATAAASSATAAASSASSASTSASTATSEASDASDSATAAASSATSAASSATTATTKASEASTSATNAASSATSASGSATTATTKASEASTSATNAASSASSASTSATTATTKATEAATSATSAASSATTATTKASEASTSATNAATSATSASSSATTATTQATAASSSATAAAASETAAAASETAAAASETAAAASETAAASSASSASTSASTATTKASEASTSATNAATSASSAATSASNASASADAALAALDNFDDRYLGQKTSDPTVDNDGNALVAGALYFNTTDDVMKVYEGSSWVAAYASLSGALLANNNLSDLQSAATARTNLGLGTAATTASTDYATAAQGALADSALQSIPDNYVLNTGDAITGNLSFGDNNKAIFGAGSDLQIYHDGSNSYVSDTGQGVLLLSGANSVDIIDGTETEYLARFINNGSSELYYDNSKKLATTSTGIDVTGTVTADGLDVSSSSNITYRRDAATFTGIELANYNNGAGSFSGITFGTNAAGTQQWYVARENETTAALQFCPATVGTPSLSLSYTGDISFYEDTGTTPKFYWDASAERLGIGTTSPNTDLEILTLTPRIRLEETTSGGSKRAEMYVDTSDYNMTLAANQSAQSMKFLTVGTERMRITSSGSVGIGTSSPTTTKLQINYTAAAENGLRLYGTNTAQNNAIQMYDASGNYITQGINAGAYTLAANGTERMRIDSSGNVGIGTSSPDAKIEAANTQASALSGTSNRNTILHLTNSDTGYAAGTASAIDFGTGLINATSSIIGRNSNSGAGGWGGQLIFATSPDTSDSLTERMRIDSSGQVNIGGATSDITATKLNVQGSGGMAVQYAASSGTLIQLVPAAANGVNYIVSDARSGGYPALGFKTTNTERMRIDSSGNVVVGGTSAVSIGSGIPSLTLKGNSASYPSRSGGIALDSYDGSYRSYIYHDTDLYIQNTDACNTRFYTNNTERMRIDSSGYVFISQMPVGGTANLHWSSAGNGQLFVTSSSSRFKHNIEDYDKGLSEVLQMQPKYFVYNDELSQKQRAGFIAEDFHALGLTEYVEYWKDENGQDEPSEIGYSNMVAILVKSIQEQQAVIESLTARIEALEN